MTLPTSGLLRATDINVELGRASNTTMRLGEDKVRGLARKPNGKVAYSDMHGKEAPTGIVVPYPPNVTTYNVNMATLARNNGWDGVSPIEFQLVIPASTTIGSTSTSVGAITTGTWPAGSKLELVVNGSVRGAGGAGGASGHYNRSNGVAQPGGAGGPAITMSYPLTIVNNGTIFGGGGGGAGSDGTTIYDLDSQSYESGNSGGGGQGDVGGSAGARNGGNSGTAGSPSAPGTGGPLQRGGYTARGGNGGAWGSAGGSTERSGGAAGYAVIRNGNVLTWGGTNGSSGTYVRGPIA